MPWRSRRATRSRPCWESLAARRRMSMLGSMVALPMPEGGPLGGPAAADQSSPLDADPLQTVLFDRFAIEVPIVGWPVPAAESTEPIRRLLRVSAALYNDRADIERLVAALGELNRPGPA